MKWRAPGNSTFLSNSFDNNPLSPWCMARLYQTQTHMCKSITSSLWRLEPDGLAGLGCIALCSAWGNLDRAQHKRQNPPWKGDESSTCYHVALSQEYQDDKDHSHACLQSFLSKTIFLGIPNRSPQNEGISDILEILLSHMPPHMHMYQPDPPPIDSRHSLKSYPPMYIRPEIVQSLPICMTASWFYTRDELQSKQFLSSCGLPVRVCVCVFFFDAPKLFWWIQVRARHVGHFRQSRVLVHFLFCATNTLSWAILALHASRTKLHPLQKLMAKSANWRLTKSLHSASGVSTTRHSQLGNGIWCNSWKESDAIELKRASTVTEIEIEKSVCIWQKLHRASHHVANLAGRKTVATVVIKTPTMEKAQSVSLLPSVPSLSFQVHCSFHNGMPTRHMKDHCICGKRIKRMHHLSLEVSNEVFCFIQINVTFLRWDSVGVWKSSGSLESS